MGTKIRLLPDNWSYRDYFAFVAAVRSGASAETFRLAQKLIASWDYKTELSQPKAIMKLGVSESAEVIRTIMEVMSKYIEDLDTKDVKVDFSQWDTERFMKFDEARRTGRLDVAEPMLKEIVVWDKLEQATDPLSFTVASTAFKAVNDAYTLIVSGKN